MTAERHSIGIRLDAKRARKTPEGFLRVPATITRTGIFQYGDRAELRHPAEVMREDSLESLKGVPITINHSRQFVTSTDISDHVVGYVGHDVKARDGRYVDATLVVWRADAVEAIESGKLRETSAGYSTKEGPAGVWQGSKFDVAQTDIRYNHVALLPEGAARGGAEMRIRLDSDAMQVLRTRLDSGDLDVAAAADALGVDGDAGLRMLLDGDLGAPDEALLTRASNMILPKVTTMKTTITVNGQQFEVEVPDAIGPHLTAAVSADAVAREQLRTDAQTQLDAAKGDAEKLRGQLDAAQARLDAIDAEKADAARAEVVEQAKKLAPAFVPSSDASAADIQRGALKAAGVDVRTDASDDYVAGLFAGAVKTAKASVGTATAAAARTDAKNENPVEAARRRMLDNAANAWKGKEAN